MLKHRGNDGMSCQELAPGEKLVMLWVSEVSSSRGGCGGGHEGTRWNSQ